jgi:hypothetical protein
MVNQLMVSRCSSRADRSGIKRGQLKTIIRRLLENKVKEGLCIIDIN